MYKFILLIAMCIVSTTIFAQNIKPQVEENHELLGVVARLAGYDEYNSYFRDINYGGLYSEHIDSAFANFKSHKVVELMKQYNEKYSISYDAVASMGANIYWNGKEFTLENMNEEQIEKRWTNVNKDEFLSELNDFYNKSNFHQFFLSQKPLYETIITAYDSIVMPKFDQEWFSKFFGTTTTNEKFVVLIGGVNGPNNYGVKRQHKGEDAEIVSSMMFLMDSAGNSLITKENGDKIGVHLTLVHEFCHAYVNPLLEKEENTKNMKSSGLYILRLSEPIMRRSAYPQWQNVVNESIVRALEISFAKDHNASKFSISQKIIYEIQNGFIWMPELVQYMDRYSKDRKKYPTFESFYPQIIKFFDQYVEKHKDALEKATN